MKTEKTAKLNTLSYCFIYQACTDFIKGLRQRDSAHVPAASAL